MTKYDKYKDSGIEWIGEIPSHWEIKRLKYISYLKTGYTPSKDDKENFSDDGIIWIKPDDLQEYKPILNSKEKISEKGLKVQNIIPKDSVLVCCIGSIGKFGIAGVNLTTNQQINSIVFTKKIVVSFGKFLIGASTTEHDRNANGNVVKILNTEKQNNISFPVPPPSEQTAISTFLDRKTTEIDELIADKKRLLELYDEEKTALINEAVTKGLNPEVPMKNSSIEWLGDIPEHWEVKRLKYIAESNPSNVDKKSKDGEQEIFLCNYVDVYKNDLITSDIQFMKATASTQQIEKFKLKKGDVIATKDSETPDDISIPALVMENFNNVICGYHLNHIRPISILGDFLFYSFKSNYSKGYFYNSANGVTRFGIGAEKFSNFPVCFPQLNEQQSIVKHIEAACNLIDEKKEKTQKLIELLTEYRTALISEVVTGKIKVI